MSAPATTVTIFFGTSSTSSGLFVLDSSLLDGVGLLGGDTGTDVTAYTVGLSLGRGKSSQVFDQFDAATGVITLNNESRLFDPLYAAGSLYGLIVPGVRVVIATALKTIFDGKVADWDFSYDVSGRSVAVAKVEDALASLGRMEFDLWTSSAGQTAGPRLTSILNRSEVSWSGGARDLGTGVSTLQADTVSWSSNVLNYCQLVAQSDVGALFASRDGLVTFRDRQYNLGATAAVAFADDGSGVAFSGIEVSFGSETFYNRVSVDRVGGTKQTVTNASSATAGVRSLSLAGLLMDSDSQSLDMATYLATSYSGGETRVSSLTVILATNTLTTAQISSVLTLDLMSLISVVYTPNGTGAAISRSCLVQGIDHAIGPASHVVTLHLGKFDNRTPFILDNATSGVLDTGPGVLTF